jgi:hypothetical protein
LAVLRSHPVLDGEIISAEASGPCNVRRNGGEAVRPNEHRPRVERHAPSCRWACTR